MRNIRIRLGQVVFRNPFRAGPHSIAITASIDSAAVGLNPHVIDASNRETVALPEAFSHVIDVDTRTTAEGRPTPIEVEFTVTMNEPGNTRRVGRVRHTVRWPFLAREYRATVDGFILRWAITAPPLPPGDPVPGVPVCRDEIGGALCTTVGGPDVLVRVEAREVLPVPAWINPATRPTFAAGVPAAFTDGRAMRARELLASGADNIVFNPPVIPIMASGTALDATNCANFKVTYYRPGDLNLLETGDDRLEWRWRPINGGEIAFFGPVNGRKVAAHGVRRGEVALELYFRNTLVAVYRALVAPLVRIPARVTISYGHATTVALRPLTTARQAATHLSRMNRYWRQAGIHFYRSSNATIGFLPAGVVAADITASGVTGVFHANVPAALTRGVSSTDGNVAGLNARPWIANFTYVKSGASGTLLGAALCREAQPSLTVTDNGTPSSSWRSPSGIPPDGEATAVTMAIRGVGVNNIPGNPNLFAMFVCENSSTMEFVNTIGHEFGHVLSLGHRGGTTANPPSVDDGVHIPHEENLMHASNPATIAQDIDLVQARTVRRSLLVQHHSP